MEREDAISWVDGSALCFMSRRLPSIVQWNYKTEWVGAWVDVNKSLTKRNIHLVQSLGIATFHL